MQRTWRFAVLIGASALGTWWFSRVHADERPQPAQALPTRVALIDMARLFNHYPRFDELRTQLRKEIETAQANLTSRIEALKKLQSELKQHPVDSPEFIKLEREFNAATAEIQSEKTRLQRDFFTKEAETYNICYRTVRAEVTRYAEAHGLDLVLRFSEEENEASDKPEEVMKRLQAQVVYHAGLDITDDVLAALR